MAVLADQVLTEERFTSSDLPSVDIIIVNYNSGQDLLKCLESLETTEAQIIVVDNASTDGTPDLVVRSFPQVRLLRSESNLGFGAGNNLGCEESEAKYLTFLNPDTTVEPGWLDALVSALEADPRAGLATSRILLEDDPGTVNTCGHDHHLSGLTLCRGLGQPAGEFTTLEQISAVSGAATLIRRDLFTRLGGFDPDFFLYMEDTDLSLRARLAGCACIFAPASVIYHRYSLSFSSLKTFYQERNRYLMLLKIYRWPTLFFLSPALLLAELVTWGFSLFRDRAHLGNKLKAYRWIIRNWGLVMRKRRQTQALRAVSDRQLLIGTTHRLEYAQTGGGTLPRLASWIFDPLFYILRGFALAFIWW